MCSTVWQLEFDGRVRRLVPRGVAHDLFYVHQSTGGNDGVYSAQELLLVLSGLQRKFGERTPVTACLEDKIEIKT